MRHIFLLKGSILGQNYQNFRFESKPFFQFLSKTNPACPSFSVTKICRCQHIICKMYRNIYRQEVAIILFESGHCTKFSYKMSSFSLFMDSFWEDCLLFQ